MCRKDIMRSQKFFPFSKASLAFHFRLAVVLALAFVSSVVLEGEFAAAAALFVLAAAAFFLLFGILEAARFMSWLLRLILLRSRMLGRRIEA